MKIQIAKQDLVGTLQQVNPSLASAGSSDDISVHYLFRAVEDGDGHKAEVLTCHGAMFSTAPLIGAVVDVPDGSPAMFTVEGKRLKQWLQTASDAALTMEYDASESEVLMTAPIGKMRFGSVDPSKFRLWDKLVKDAEVKSTVKAVKLKDAFDYTHRFCSEDRQRPDLIVFESRDGALMATDGTAAAKVTVPDLGDEVFRVLGKEDTPKFVAFLGTAAEDDDVTVLVHPRALILKKADGALMGERKPDKGFPKDFSVGTDADDDQVWWEVPVAEMQRRIKFLTSGADAADSRLRLQQDGDEAILSMATVGGKVVKTTVEGLVHGRLDDAPDLPDKGVLVSHFILSKVLALHPEETLKIGFNRRKNSGYLRHFYEADGVEYLTVIVWLRDA
jgi:hypothetical protein